MLDDERFDAHGWLLRRVRVQVRDELGHAWFGAEALAVQRVEPRWRDAFEDDEVAALVDLAVTYLETGNQKAQLEESTQALSARLEELLATMDPPPWAAHYAGSAAASLGMLALEPTTIMIAGTDTDPWSWEPSYAAALAEACVGDGTLVDHDRLVNYWLWYLDVAVRSAWPRAPGAQESGRAG